ncbi:hypothetical protein [Pseudolysinimonas sp.]|uniref:hypothetical protein n=1 Tax=Pseudolysinimonas sp. TaxID=2680009 RepID=UPI003F7E1CF0
MTLQAVGPLAGSGHANEVVLKHLGEVAVDASRLELVAREVARAVKLRDPEDRTVPRLQRERFVPPPWSVATAKDVAGWAGSVARLLDTRDRMFAASGGAHFSGSRGDTIATESADGTMFPADEEYLGRLLHRLERQLAAGRDLLFRLDYHDESGQRWPLVQLYAAADDEQRGMTIANLPADWRAWLSA